MPSNYSQSERNKVTKATKDFASTLDFNTYSDTMSNIASTRETDLTNYRLAQSRKMGNPGSAWSNEAVASRDASGSGLAKPPTPVEEIPREINKDFITESTMPTFSELSGNTNPYADSMQKSFQAPPISIDIPTESVETLPDISSANNVPKSDELGEKMV
mgnify:FL=1